MSLGATFFCISPKNLLGAFSYSLKMAISRSWIYRRLAASIWAVFYAVLFVLCQWLTPMLLSINRSAWSDLLSMFKTTPLTIWLMPFQWIDLRERRANITEGQRQLVTIARAIPRIGKWLSAHYFSFNSSYL
jgi:hypothetical protein